MTQSDKNNVSVVLLLLLLFVLHGLYNSWSSHQCPYEIGEILIYQEKKKVKFNIFIVQLGGLAAKLCRPKGKERKGEE